jgi:Xaa-Pro dipeptidase
MSIERMRAWLEPAGADAAVVTNPVSITYLTGFRADPMERLMALVLSPERAVFVVPGLEHDNAATAAAGTEVIGWEDGDDAYRVLAGVIGRARRLAVEKDHLTLARAEEIERRTGASELLDCGTQLRRLRAVKSRRELELLGRAAEITDRVTAEVLGQARAGVTERQVANHIAELIFEAACGLSFGSLAQSGPNSALPHLGPTGRRLEPGDLLLLDFGAACDGYCADTTRMAVVGEPDARQREVHEQVLRAHDEALARVRPGVTTGEIDAAAREVLEAAGLGLYFIHRVGHGLGLEAHEGPSLDPGSTVPLEEGMVITIEPGAYIPGWGGIRIEDDVVVEGDGARMLTAFARELHVLG